MRPVPIPEGIREEWAAEGGAFSVLSAPSGDLTDPEVRPVEACFHEMAVAGEGDALREGQPVTSVVMALEDDDLEMLAATGMFVLSVWGHGFPVFMLTQVRPRDEEEE